jgi:hypothetical protein
MAKVNNAMSNNRVSTAIKRHARLTDLVLDFNAITKRLFDEVKQPGFTEASWMPLRAMVAVEQFKWVTPSYEELSWQEYINFQTEWARTVSWESSAHRIHQWQNIVFLEQEERCTFGDTVTVSGSVAVYEFNDIGKIQRLATYMQHTPSLGL